MTGFLVDTHVLLWWASSSGLLGHDARMELGSGRNQLLFSFASIWEINIKIAIGRIELPDTTDELMLRARCKPLPITLLHLNLIKDLPNIHSDPFDRMLIAQAKSDGLVLITRDSKILEYDVATLAA